jgi:hypothetical protein
MTVVFACNVERRRENDGPLPAIELPPLKDASAEGRRRRGAKNKVAPGEEEPEANVNAEQEAPEQPVRGRIFSCNHTKLSPHSYL